jgi:hypothetical protein
MPTFDPSAPFFRNAAAARPAALAILERGLAEESGLAVDDILEDFAGPNTEPGIDDYLHYATHERFVRAALAIGVALGQMLQPSALPDPCDDRGLGARGVNRCSAGSDGFSRQLHTTGPKLR